MSIETIAKNIGSLVNQIDQMLDTATGHELSNQAAKLAIQLEYLLENKAQAKQNKNATYAASYEQARKTMSQGDAKIFSDAEKDYDFDRIEAIESGVKSVLSTIKSKLDWLKLEQHNKGL